MAPSIQQPLNRQGVLRINRQGQNTLVTTPYGTGQRKSDQRIKLGTANLATLRGEEDELVEVMKMRTFCILALVETRINGK